MSSRYLTCLVVIITLLRVVYLAVCGLELAPDEAYYWDWSRQLDVCYYSKPPMVAWAIAASTAVLGDTAFGVRLPAVLFGGVGLFALSALARTLYSERVATWAVLLMICSPANMLFNLLMTIDAPLISFWTLSLLGVAKAVRTDQQGYSGQATTTKWGWWAFAGIFGGLALLSKQTAIAIPAITCFFLLVTPCLRGQLLKGFALYAAILAASLLPLFYWNARNGWITLVHTSEHFGAKKSYDGTLDWLGDRIGDFAGFAAAEFALASPVSFILMALVTLLCGWRFFKLRIEERWLYLLGPLPFIGVFCLALLQRVQPNWPAPFMITTLVLTAGWLDARIGKDAVSVVKVFNIKASLLLKSAFAVGGVMALAFYLLPVWAMLPGGVGLRVVDATRRIHGWSLMASNIQALREGAALPPDHFVVFAGGRGPVSTLGFYLPDQPRVFLWQYDDRILSQHDWWAHHRDVMSDYLGMDALLIVGAHEGYPAEDHLSAEMLACFTDVVPLGLSETLVGSGHIHRFQVFHARDLLAWPVKRP